MIEFLNTGIDFFTGLLAVLLPIFIVVRIVANKTIRNRRIHGLNEPGEDLGYD